MILKASRQEFSDRMPILYTIGRVGPRPRRTYPYSLIIVGICVVVFILQLGIPAITDSFLLLSEKALVRPWTFITSMFLHADFTHLFYNMFALGIFGFILEKIIGSRRFLILYFSAGLVAGIASLFFYSAVLGASGAIMGVLGCLAVLRPRMSVWVMYVPMPMIIAAGLWILFDLLGMFSPGNVANAAHLGGMFLGLAYGLWLRKQFSEPRKRIIQPLSENQINKWEDRYM